MRRRRSLRGRGDPRCCRHALPQRFLTASWPIAMAVATCGGVISVRDYDARFLRVAAPALRHCEELLRRSNPGCLRGESLDCFAALAMTGVAAVARTPPAMSPGRPWNSSPPLFAIDKLIRQYLIYPPQ
ncbi:hypothetical protein CDS [Bradyrhizobium sp.]|nr:hypothetical protein CDS [Bradyrhizobium sp.]